MPVVTIARQLGSEGEAIAALVGRQLEARVLDRELLVEASARSGIPVESLMEMDERGRSMFGRPADLVRLVPMPPIDPEAPDVTGDRYPPTGPVQARGQGLTSPAYWAAEAYATLLGRTMRTEAAEGSVVIVGRAGNEVLRGHPGALHVLVVAPERLRVQRVMEAEGLEGYHALDRVRRSDRERGRYVRQFYGARWLDPQRYDLVLNTAQLTAADGAEVVVSAARALAREAGRPAAPAVAAPTLRGA
jgi:hypothetical protein